MSKMLFKLKLLGPSRTKLVFQPFGESSEPFIGKGTRAPSTYILTELERAAEIKPRCHMHTPRKEPTAGNRVY